MKANDLLLAPLRILNYLLERIIAAAGALTGAQVPEFINQYIQRLGGHVTELGRIISQYRDGAAGSGRDLQTYIQLFQKSSVPEFAKTGSQMGSNLERYTELKAALEELGNASGIDRLFAFLKNLNMDIISGTIKDFQPGFPLSLEGFLYGITCMFISALCYTGIKKALQRITGGRNSNS